MSKKNDIKNQLDNFVENYIKEDFGDIISDRFSRYSKYIIQDRALPDARDGLKPVQRRILYSMYKVGMFSNQPYKKSARIAGEVMGKYHPHGDGSIYNAMVRLSQDFKMLTPLIDMHGNNGSIDGDSAAAMRYTEARLSKAAELLLEDINARTVNFVPNFDDEEIEPTVLPAKFPNLLINGAIGISAGYATKIPPHNTHEVIKATIALIKNENLETKDIMKYIKGPDFPTGGLVQGKDGIFNALDKGSGKVVIRSIYHVEKIKKDQYQLIIDQIPFDVNKSDLVKSIDMLKINKKFEDISEIRDESDKDGLRIVIDLKKGKSPDLAVNYLFKNTDLQINYHYNMVSIMNNRPVQSGVIPILKTYIYHQKDIIRNRSNYYLKKSQTRLHIVEGLIRMSGIINEIIEDIKRSKNKKSSKELIMKKYNFTEVQSEAIVTLQLYKLSNTDALALQQEENSLKENIDYLKNILSSDDELSNLIISELKTTEKLIGRKRISLIEDDIETIKIDEKELIAEENVMIGITKDGYFKRSNLKSYQLSRTTGIKNEDFLIYENEHTTLQTLLMFTNKGNFIYLPIYKLDDQKWKDLGIYVNNIISMENNETIIDIFSIDDFKIPSSIILVTKKGMIKHVNLDLFEISRYQKTTKAISLDKDDELVRAIISEGHYISLITINGNILNFYRDEIPYYGLSAKGVRTIKLNPGDFLSTVTTFDLNENIHILSSRGNLISHKAEDIKISHRNRKGYKLIENIKSQPHIAKFAKALPKKIDEQYTFTAYTNKNKYNITFKDAIAVNNKFGKNIFSSKKEVLYNSTIPIFKEDKYTINLRDRSNSEDNNELEITKKEQNETKIDIIKIEKKIENNEKIEILDLSKKDDGKKNHSPKKESNPLIKENIKNVNEKKNVSKKKKNIKDVNKPPKVPKNKQKEAKKRKIEKINKEKITITRLNLFDEEE